MDTPVDGTARPRWTAGRIVRVIVGWMLVAFGAGLAFVMIVGLVLHPEALGRRFDSVDSTVPTWPFQIGWILLNLAIAALGLRLSLVAPKVHLRRPRALPVASVDDVGTVRDPAGAAPPADHIRSRERQLAQREPVTWLYLLRAILGVLLAAGGVFLVLAALGLIATSGWDYLWSASPAAGFGSSNLESIIALGVIGAMLVMGGWSLVAERPRPRAPRVTGSTDAAPSVTDRVG